MSNKNIKQHKLPLVRFLASFRPQKVSPVGLVNTLKLFYYLTCSIKFILSDS